MNKTLLRVLTLLCAMLMLVGTVGLVACTTPGDGDTTTTAGGDNPDNTPETTWLVGDMNEKLAALENYYGRNMSVAWGGDTVNHAPASIEAINSAIALGADAVGIIVKKTSDNVLIALVSNDLYDSTHFTEMKGKDGLPSKQTVSAWTYEQVQKLSLKNSDGTASESKVLKLEDVVAACAGKCFVYIKNIEDFAEDAYKGIYEVAKAKNAYTSFVITPGAKAVASWADTYKTDENLKSAIDKDIKKFYHQEDYFNVRAVVDPTKSDDKTGWKKVNDDAEGWQKAYEAKKTLLLTDNIGAYTQWILEKFKSALEYTPDQFDNISYSLNKEDLTARYMFISDLHYTPVEDSGYINRVTYRGYSTDERMKHMCANIEAEYNARGLDAIFILGDLTTDDPPHRTSGIYLDDLYEKYLNPLAKKLNIPILSTGGNHDGHSNEYWNEVTGHDRQFVWENTKTGDVVLIVDTFNPETTDKNVGGSGVAWSGNDEKWIEEQLEKYKDRKNIFIGSHYFSRGAGLFKLAKLIKKYDNVRALFDGHSHSYTGDTVTLRAEIGQNVVTTDKKIINTGSYSYGDWGMGTYYGSSSTNDFNYHDFDDIWGYNIVEITANTALSYRIDVDAYYCANNYSTLGKPGGVFIEVRDYRPYTKWEDIVFYK